MNSKDIVKKPAVILGCHKLGLGVIRALGAGNVPVIGIYYNKNDMGFVSKHVARAYAIPNPETDEKTFIDVLLKIGAEFRGAVIMPSDDPTLLATSKNKSKLEKYYKVACSNWEIIEKILVKKNTYRIADKAGVPIPKTYTPHSINEAKRCIRKVGLPCLLKPSIGHKFFKLFKKKMLTIENEKQLESAYKISSQAQTEMMLQELIPGDDTHGFNYNSYFVKGRPMVEFTAQKCRLSPPKTGFPRVIVSKLVPEIIEYGRKMLIAIGYNGYSCMEFKKDARDGIYKLMEVNGRQNLSTSLAVKCGINFPYLTYLHELSGKFPVRNYKFKNGVYWIDFEKDIVESIKSLKSERYSIRSYILPYVKPKVFCIASLNDPKPIVKRAADAAKVFFAKLGVYN